MFFAVVLVTLGSWAYATSFRGVFVWDDLATIVENPHIRSLWPLSEAMGAPHDTTLSARPVASLTFALNYALAPAAVRDTMKPRDGSGSPDAAARFLRNVWGYHAVNLAIHILAALALFGTVGRTLQTRALVETAGRAAGPIAFAVAAIWVVHPLTTPAVTYLVQRVESLMSLFYLLTLYCAVRAGAGGSRPRWWAAGAVVACLLGMGTKESMVTAPLAVVLWDWTFAEPGAWRRRRALYAGLAATWLLLAWLVSLDLRPAAGFWLDGWTPWSYLRTQAAVIVHYLRLAVVPYPLVFDYRWEAVPGFVSVAPQFGALAAAVVGTGWLVARRHPAGFVAATFFLVLAPTSSLLPIATEVAAEHRMYLPLTAVVALLVVGGYLLITQGLREPGRRRAEMAGVLAVAVIVVVFAVMTRDRNTLYWSEETLMAETVARRPANAPARLALGSVLVTEQRFAEAEPHLRAVLALPGATPMKAHAHMFLGTSLCASGRMSDGIEHLRSALQLDPGLTDARALLAESLLRAGDPATAKREFETVLAATPDNPVLLRFVAWFLATSPRDDVRNGARAATLAERARELSGGRDPIALEALGAAYAEMGRFDLASAVLEQALALARQGGPDGLVAALEQELAQVRAGRPLR